jgi:hypothetical protein
LQAWPLGQSEPWQQAVALPNAATHWPPQQALPKPHCAFSLQGTHSPRTQIGLDEGQSLSTQHTPLRQPPPQQSWPPHAVSLMHVWQLWFVQAAPPQSALEQQVPA